MKVATVREIGKTLLKETERLETKATKRRTSTNEVPLLPL